jgi:predicted AlkP superfamily phosphohydrolase/phosphomutase
VGQSRASLQLERGVWTAFQRVRFKTGLFTSVSGIVRFLLVSIAPKVELYASPINFDPSAPLFPISHPHTYAHELEESLGLYHTLGMPEDHTGLTNERFTEEDFLNQAEGVLMERERMLHHELGRSGDGLAFCLFDTPDRIQHMFWRFREPDHPSNAANPTLADYSNVIDAHYERCDRIVADVLQAADERTLVMVLSDHGFNSFRRGVHLNRWLEANGWLALKPGSTPDEAGGDFFRQVDWGRTRAYALGFGSIYLNLAGREGEGIVPSESRAEEAARLARDLSGLEDRERGIVAIRGVRTRDELYSGPRVEEAPDVVVEFATGYRASWSTALGGVPEGLFEDNTRKWAGDHIVDPLLVPGVLFMNRRFNERAPRLVDCTATILDALGVPVPGDVEGSSLLTA